jgi:hypothetical protein
MYLPLLLLLLLLLLLQCTVFCVLVVAQMQEGRMLCRCENPNEEDLLHHGKQRNLNFSKGVANSAAMTSTTGQAEPRRANDGHHYSCYYDSSTSSTTSTTAVDRIWNLPQTDPICQSSLSRTNDVPRSIFHRDGSQRRWLLASAGAVTSGHKQPSIVVIDSSIAP